MTISSWVREEHLLFCFVLLSFWVMSHAKQPTRKKAGIFFNLFFSYKTAGLWMWVFFSVSFVRLVIYLLIYWFFFSFRFFFVNLSLLCSSGLSNVISTRQIKKKKKKKKKVITVSNPLTVCVRYLWHLFYFIVPCLIFTMSTLPWVHECIHHSNQRHSQCGEKESKRFSLPISLRGRC